MSFTIPKNVKNYKVSLKIRKFLKLFDGFSIFHHFLLFCLKADPFALKVTIELISNWNCI